MLGLSLEKAYIETVNATDYKKIPVLFNPAEYSIERANAYKSTPLPSIGSPLIQFINGDAQTLSLELFLDDWTDPKGPPSSLLTGAGEIKSVKDRIDEIVDLMDIDSGLHAPPRVKFHWGPLIFEAVIEKVGRKITLFRPDGTPARATLSVAFREYKERKREAPHVRLESADKTKRRQISASEDIWMIAYREYGDPRQWRFIASASDIDDPRALEPGTWLSVPPLEMSNALNRV